MPTVSWHKHLDGFWAALERVLGDEVAEFKDADHLDEVASCEDEHVKGPLGLLGALRKVLKHALASRDDSDDSDYSDEMDRWDAAADAHDAEELHDEVWHEMKKEMRAAVHFAVKKARVRALFVHWQEASYATNSAGRKRHLREFEKEQ